MLSMENPENNPDKQVPTENNNKLKINYRLVFKSLFSIFVVVALGVVIYLGYTNLEKLNSDLSASQKSVDEINGKLLALQEQSSYNNNRIDNIASTQANAQKDLYQIPVPTFSKITVEKVLEDKNSALENGFRFVILDVKLENNTQNDIYYSTGELKLKDAESYEYPFFGQDIFSESYVKKDSKVMLPDNRIPLSYAMIKPGEIVKGSAVFVINRPTVNKFTLMRNGEVLKNIDL